MLPLEAADYIITNPFYDTRFIQRLKRHGCDVIFSEEPEDYWAAVTVMYNNGPVDKVARKSFLC